MKILAKREQSQTGLNFDEREKIGLKVKRLFQWMLAAILICGATTFTSCTNEDNPANPAANLSEKILGKWEAAERDGEPITTNKKTIFTFVSATKAYVSASRNSHPEMNPSWMDKLEADVVIIGDKITLTFHPDEHKTSVHEFSITSINGSEFSAFERVTVRVDGNVILSSEQTVRFEKTTADYAEPILGLWECEGLIGDETYNDGNDRLEFLSDGTYRYYRKNDAGQWQAVTTRDFQDYFVDGTLLATRWKNKGEAELREWWEIESLSGNEMVWTALRQNPDGSTFQQKMTWKKIDLKVAEKLLGKWMDSEADGQPALTTGKMVVTFVSPTKALYTTSKGDFSESQRKWSDHREYAATIAGNKVTLTGHPDGNPKITLQEEFIISSITANEIVCNYKHTTIHEGQEQGTVTEQKRMRLKKIDTDYHTDIVGLWECKGISGGETYNDANARLEFFNDATYKYYRKNDGGLWEAVTNREFQEYIADGTLVAIRWKDQGMAELRECWEVNSLKDGKMQWKALRAKEDGTTFEQTVDWERIELE